MKHLSINECISLLLGILEEKKRIYAEGHIQTCKECSVLYNKLKPSFSPEMKDQIVEPGNMLKKRILYSAAGLREQDNSNRPNATTIRGRIRRHIVLIGSAAVAAIVFTVAGLLLIETNPASEFLVARIYGKADINAIPARIFDTVIPGNTISTEANSALTLWFSREYKVMLMGKSLLTIDKARLNNKNRLEVKYTLDNGTLLNRHKHEDTNISYAFVTPHALINAEDADLMLHASKNESSILLIKGRFEVQEKNSKNKTTIDSPGRYIISDGNMISAEQNTRDTQAIDEAFNMHDDEEALAFSNFYSTPAYDSARDTDKENLMNEITGILTDYSTQSQDDHTDQ